MCKVCKEWKKYVNMYFNTKKTRKMMTIYVRVTLVSVVHIIGLIIIITVALNECWKILEQKFVNSK
jgi:hypothetical protein